MQLHVEYSISFRKKEIERRMIKILMVEDDLAFGTLIQTWLKKKGFDVVRATSVKAALQLLNEDSKKDLILSDLRLPDHDGLTLLNWIQKHNMPIPFIVMTSYAEVQNAVLAMKSGATDYIAKPFHTEALQAVIGINGNTSEKPSDQNLTQPFPNNSDNSQPLQTMMKRLRWKSSRM